MGDVTRRVFLGQAGTAAIAGAAVANANGIADSGEAEKYRPFVGQTFRLSSDGKTWAKCVLNEVEDLGPAPRAWLPKPGSLMFRTEDGVSLSQGTYMVAHNRMPARRLLVTPVGKKQDLQVILA